MACRLTSTKLLSEILLIGPLGTNFNEILIEMHTFSFKKMHLSNAINVTADDLVRWGARASTVMELTRGRLNTMMSYQYRYPMLKIRRSLDCLINMGIPIPGKNGLYIETGPWFSCNISASAPQVLMWQQRFHSSMFVMMANGESLRMADDQCSTVARATIIPNIVVKSHRGSLSPWLIPGEEVCTGRGLSNEMSYWTVINYGAFVVF